MLPIRKGDVIVFEVIEKAMSGCDMVVAPQNHPQALLSFVWDATADAVAE
jgi:hypothetical protein